MARAASIKRELSMLVMLTSGLALLLACAGFLINDVLTLRGSMVRHVSVLAQVAADNSAVALLFGDAETAEEILAALSAEPRITRASVYGADGELFASYRRGDVEPSLTYPPVGADGSRFERDRLVHFQEVRFEADRLGTVFVESDLQEVYARLTRYGVITTVFLLGSLLVAVLVASRLQRRIADPILHLAGVARAVSEEKEYSLRANATSREDEIGTLVHGFNQMLDRIQKRDLQVAQHSEHLEEEVDARTAELRMVNIDLERATRAKSEFLANMSHELRTPLNAVIGFSEVLQQEMFGELNEKQQEYVEDILSSGRHLLSLINDILDLSKIEAGRMELLESSFDLAELIASTAVLVRERAARHGLTVECDVEEGIGEHLGDERKIKQVLLNLMSNAVKFTPDGGKVSLRARRTDDGLELQVEDTGIGIARDEIDTIFDEFQQVGDDTEMKREGTGLGLALAKSFVGLHGGKIWAESEKGVGSRFIFTLPRGARAADPPAEVASGVLAPQTTPLADARRAPAPRGRRVLLVEDDAKLVELLSERLQQAGYEFMIAWDEAEGLDKARMLGPEVVVIDSGRSPDDGWVLIDALKGDPTTAEIPVIVSSSPADPDRGLDLGGADFLAWPLDPGELIRSLDSLFPSRGAKEMVEGVSDG